MQCALHNDRDFGCFGELRDSVWVRRFRRRDRQGAPEAYQIIRICVM